MARASFEHDYPPADWSVDGIAGALEECSEEFPLPTYEDAEFWSAIAVDDLTGAVVEDVLARAEAETGEPVPPLPASLYLNYARTGNRSRYQAATNERVERLSTFALAECVEREGNYLDDVLDHAWAICEQATWLLPAHLGRDGQEDLEGLPDVVPDEERTVALRSARTAQLLAEIGYVLGEQVHPALHEQIRHEVDRRVVTPYEAREDFEWFGPPTSNWNAVCNTGAAIAALHLIDDPERQARVVAKAARSLEHYLSSFDHDGCTAEGISYWNYGFRHYVQLAAHLDARTGGAYSLLSPPIVERIARYPLKVEMSPGHFIPFSDAVEEVHVDPFTACWLGRRLDLPGLAAHGRRGYRESASPGGFGDTLRALREVRRVPAEWAVPTPPRRIYFTGNDWWLSRGTADEPDGVVVAAKGGHNAEPHNHNDLGSFVFHVRRESLLTDLGSPVYDAGFFSDRRYEYLVARSLGHNVPHVNGIEQAEGEEHAATVLERTDDEGADSFTVDLTDAYPEEAGLSSLVRTITLDRTADRLSIEDVVDFDAVDNDFVEVLVSYFPMEARDDGVEVTGENGRATVVAEPSPDDVDVERIEDAVRGDDVWRTRLSYHPDERIDVTLHVAPE